MGGQRGRAISCIKYIRPAICFVIDIDKIVDFEIRSITETLLIISFTK